MRFSRYFFLSFLVPRASRVRIISEDKEKESLYGMGLAPLAVEENERRKGYGGYLVKELLKEFSRTSDLPFIVV